MSMGRGAIVYFCCKQRMNVLSLTKSKVISSSNALPRMI